MCACVLVVCVFVKNKKQFLYVGKSIKCDTITKKQLTALPKWSFVDSSSSSSDF